MLIVERGSGSIRDGSFRDFPELLSAGDILVLNDTRVFPARVHGLRAETGGNQRLYLYVPTNPARGPFSSQTA